MQNPQDETTPEVLTPQELLGVIPEGDASSIVNRYTQLRKHSGNALGVLAAQSSEYNRIQGTHNFEFIQNIVGSFPASHIDLSYDDRQTRAHPAKYHHATIQSLESRFHVPAQEEAPDQAIAELAGIRSATIWLRQKAADSHDLEVNNDYGSASFVSSLELWRPHVIIGHQIDEKESKTRLLLVPTISNQSAFKFSGQKRDTLLSTRATITPKRGIVTATMKTAQYMQLRAMQDALFSTPFTPHEIEHMHDGHTGRLILDGDNQRIIRAEHCAEKLLKFKKGPADIDELSINAFDMHIGGMLDRTISPMDFLQFNVMEDALRTSAMLGRAGAFEVAKTHLIRVTEQDPQTKLVNGK
ncbi:MAG TPA: hypothetical protein PKD20_01580 [Candidatus Saccharibacteria bacterium]|jgi:hypothetical protein|nr:hypothetical protein [Candidatus Saccharibacteria bacterium]HMT55549.1 hypothetical protein [Candidatus Saccharibacteria bacterium]